MLTSDDIKSLRKHGDKLFEAKRPLDSRNQAIAENFYVERADFTVADRSIGDEYADHLLSGYPLMVRRKLGDGIGSMLRPKGKKWFDITTKRPERIDQAGREFLDFASGLQRRAMYDKKSLFTRATKEGDHDFATFGGASISVQMNRRDNTLLYRCWHLRDCAWSEDSYGQLNTHHRIWKPTAKELKKYFGEQNLHPNVARLANDSKRCDETVLVRHVITRADEVDWKASRHPWVSVYIDVENDHAIECVGSWTRKYVVPRWATVSGSQYPFSPASIIALPDARLLQAMTLTLLDAGERAADPPLVGVGEAIRGDLQIYPGGFTSVDAEYDEKMGEALRTLDGGNPGGLAYGLQMLDRSAGQLMEAFYLNTLSMPPHDGPEMTAYEVGQRVQEYIREALPLFEPMEDNYNGELCDMTFETLMREGAFGGVDRIPESIQGAETDFSFESPLHDMIEREMGQRFLEAKAMAVEAEGVSPGSSQIMKFEDALRDTLVGLGTPNKWIRSVEEYEEEKRKMEEAQNTAGFLENAERGSAAAAQAAQAAAAIQQSQAPVQ